MSSENEQLYSSDGENEHPRKIFKSNLTYNISHPELLTGSSSHVWQIVKYPIQNNSIMNHFDTNNNFFINPNSNSCHASGLTAFFCNINNKLTAPAKKHAATVYLIAKIAQKLECFIKAKSYCKNIDNMDSQSNTSHIVFGANKFLWTKPPKNNLQKKPKEWKRKYLPISFWAEENEAHSIILKNILVQDSNPEQQIPRLIELAKMLLEWAAPKGTSYSNKEIK
ncbi:hypothetical protein BY996DRAFT_6409843 [Phakopsora pachyrhizi]|nr:hypothetical protein BY996DRAFT_6409843 [Phakopsora pachyrhizi]